MENKFVYVDEDDKCYGLTGMVLSLNIWDCGEMLALVSLDGPTSIDFTPDFYFNGNPRFSARLAWNEMVKQFQMMTGLMLGNVMCRMVVRKRQNITQDLIETLRDVAAQEGREACELDADEVDTIFRKTYRYLAQVYANPQLASVAHQFAAYLKEHRSLSGDEANDQLMAFGLR